MSTKRETGDGGGGPAHLVFWCTKCPGFLPKPLRGFEQRGGVAGRGAVLRMGGGGGQSRSRDPRGVMAVIQMSDSRGWNQGADSSDGEKRSDSEHTPKGQRAVGRETEDERDPRLWAWPAGRMGLPSFRWEGRRRSGLWESGPGLAVGMGSVAANRYQRGAVTRRSDLWFPCRRRLRP